MKIKNIIIVGISIIFSIVLGYYFQMNNTQAVSVMDELDTSGALFTQEVIAQSETPVEITKLYRENQLIGIIYDQDKITSMANDVYETEYVEEFPESQLGFMDDIYQLKELSYSIYENKDEEIFNYIKEEDLFAIEVNKIEFSNGAIIYVKNLEDFYSAREDFILNFISVDTYNLLRNEQALPPMSGYGTRDVSFAVKENLTFSKGLATRDNILINKDEITSFLNYGYNPKIEEYTIQDYDTVTSISYLNGMTTGQLMSINPELQSADQILAVGDTLNITYYNSPLTVSVQKERKVSQEIVAPDAIIKEDPNLPSGERVIDVEEKKGKADVVYTDMYINGAVVSTEEVSYTVVEEPVRQEVRLGTYVEPYTGSGNYRMPINNYTIQCHWGCYAGHKGTDFFQADHGTGTPIFAIDTGVVVEAAYGGGWGYYAKVDHGDGTQSLYAHMGSYPSVSVGQTVTKNSVLGYLGGTGYVTAPHLHLEIYSGGTRINPCSVIGC